MKISNDRSYEEMLIFINDNVPEENGYLLKNIQTYMKEASKALYKSTSNLENSLSGTGVQFGKIYIKVPTNWKLENIPKTAIQPITWQQCNRADFFVSLSIKDDMEIFNKQLGKCGESGEFIKFPHKFFLQTNPDSDNNREIRKLGKTIVSEFARLRYGVFPEKPYKGQLTVFNGTHFINSTCGNDIEWRISNSMAYCSEQHSDCKYDILPDQQVQHSLMFDQSIDSNGYFCNSHSRPHNHLAYNLHNIKCDSKSVAEVILQHNDFKENLKTVAYSDPSFVIVKGRPRKIVFLLDASHSMFDSFYSMKTAVQNILMNFIEDDAEVAVVACGNEAVNVQAIIKMKEWKNRQDIIQKINSINIMGHTNIPRGLRQGVTVLGGNINDDKPVYGTIILLSNGAKKEEKKYEDYMKQIVKKGIVVNVISYSNEVDAKLSKLVADSGGQYLFASTVFDGDFMQLRLKFGVGHSCDLKINQTEVNFHGSRTVQFNANMKEESIYLDQFLGNNVKLDISISDIPLHLTMVLIQPDGTELKPKQFEITGKNALFSFYIGTIHNNGEYKIKFVKNSIEQIRMKRASKVLNQDDFLSFNFSVSSVTDESLRQINPSGRINTTDIVVVTPDTVVRIIVDLTECGIKDKDESVTVVLFVKRENQLIYNNNMTDDGTGDDSISNDKIYTKLLYSKNFLKQGFYNFDAQILIYSNNGKYKIQRTLDLGSLRVHQDYSRRVIEDKIAPAQIGSVKIISLNQETKVIKMEFEAVGDDNNDGRIDRYECKILNSNNSEVFPITRNMTPGEIIQITLDLSNLTFLTKSNYFETQIRGIDESNNVGQWSMKKSYSWNYKEILKEVDKNYRLIKPAQINHFYIKSFNQSTKQIQFVFTAVGNDGMKGNIFIYELLISSSKEQVSLKIKKETKPNQEVELELNLNEIDSFQNIDSLSFQIRAINDLEIVGEWSKYIKINAQTSYLIIIITSIIAILIIIVAFIFLFIFKFKKSKYIIVQKNETELDNVFA